MVHGGPCRIAERDVAGGGGLLGGLEHRGIDDPGECPIALADQTELLRDGATCRAEQGARGLHASRAEEDAVARLGADVLGDPGALGIGDVLRDRAGQLAVLADENVGQTLGPALLRPFLPRVELAARLRGAALHHHGTDVRRLEHAERRVLEVFGALDELDVETQVGLIGAEPAHRLVIGDPRDRGGDLVAGGLPHVREDVLGERDHVVLVDEAHLHVELGELGLAVGAEILVAVAAGDLVIPLHSRHHEQLLEQLRGLRERIERARLQSRGNQEVAGALGGRTGQCRRLDLDEIMLAENLAGGGVDLRAQAQRLARTFAAQVEVAVA